MAQQKETVKNYIPVHNTAADMFFPQQKARNAVMWLVEVHVEMRGKDLNV